MQQEANINLNQCYKEIWNFGSTTYQNICSGGLQTVPWGSLDWIIFLIVIGFIVGILFTFFKIAK